AESIDVQPLTWKLGGLALVTLEPKRLIPSVTGLVTHVCAVGEDPTATLEDAAELVGERPPGGEPRDLRKGEALLWRRGDPDVPLIELVPASFKRRRHRRKYVEGELPPERSFYFRGPADALSLRVQNLQLFMQVASGVDDATWEWHLRAGDYSRWIQRELKDSKLAERVGAVERDRALSAAESRARVRELIESRYAPPA
ncbi:MAG TPA: hypothetical protein VFG86_10130, partial [Chloroflexota bacterium]|nr:hypothetical protein [Chloroflexota bacterium]